MATAVQVYSIVIVGDPGVGKRSFGMRVKTGEFVENLPCDMDHILECPMKIDNTEILVQLRLDFYHRSTGRNLGRIYRNADAIILMYSIEDNFSLENLPEYYEEVTSYSQDPKEVTVAVIGSKIDLFSEIEPERIEWMCSNLETKLSFFISAKTGEGVKESLEEIIEAVHGHSNTEKSQSAVQRDSIKIKAEIKSKRSRCS